MDVSTGAEIRKSSPTADVMWGKNCQCKGSTAALTGNAQCPRSATSLLFTSFKDLCYMFGRTGQVKFHQLKYIYCFSNFLNLLSTHLFPFSASNCSISYYWIWTLCFKATRISVHICCAVAQLVHNINWWNTFLFQNTSRLLLFLKKKRNRSLKSRAVAQNRPVTSKAFDLSYLTM